MVHNVNILQLREKLIVLDIGVEGAGFPGEKQLCKVVLPDGSSHLSEQGKSLNQRFRDFLLQTRTDAVDDNFEEVPLGILY